MSASAATSWIVEQWAARFAAAYEAMAGEQIRAEVSARHDADAWAEAHHWRQAFDAAPGAAVEVSMPAEAWGQFGRKVLAAAGIDDATDDDARSTYLELLQQSLSGVASALTARLGREVTCAAGQLASGHPPQSAAGLVLKTDSGLAAQVLIAVSPELDKAAGQPAAQAPAAQPGKLASASGPAPHPGSTGPMDLLYDVELPVSVSFGRAHLPLKEVLRLTSGSIVELNRGIAEPVELIVNNCVVARGEVVVVEGNYGVRILQVISRGERLRTLH